MNKQELIEKYKSALNKVHKVYGDYYKTEAYEEVLKDLKRLDEHENGHADEAPRYVKNILARLRELPLHDREFWLKTIMGEFEQDFSRAKWREGYEQGKVEGLIGREKVTITQDIADYIEYAKENDWDLQDAMDSDFIASEEDRNLSDWFYKDNNMETFALAWINGYIVKGEKRYLVKVIGMSKFYECLNFDTTENRWKFFDCDNTKTYRTQHTRKELEEANCGWVFDCPGIEIEEVE